MSDSPARVKPDPLELSAWLIDRAYPDLVAGAGLLILTAAFTWSGTRLDLSGVRLVFFLAYALADLLRINFSHQTRISCGFPILVLIALLYPDSPLMALVSAAIGSVLSEVVSEVLTSILVPRELPWVLLLRRARFYAGHHVIASAVAWLAYQSTVHWRSPIQEIPVSSAVAYVLAYSAVSMALVWPHDRAIRYFVALDTKPLVRVDPAALFWVPIPAGLLYLRLVWESEIAVWLVFLPIIVLVLYALGLVFSWTAKSQMRFKLREKVQASLMYAIDIDEVARYILEAALKLIPYRWGAVYGSDSGEFLLQKCGEQDVQGEMRYSPRVSSDPKFGEWVYAHTSTLGWPIRISNKAEIWGSLTEDKALPRYQRVALSSKNPAEPLLPAQTALIAWPILNHQSSENVLGLIILARSKKPFTRDERDKGFELARLAAPRFDNAQSMKKVLARFGRDHDAVQTPEQTSRAMEKLVQERVNIAGILERVAADLHYGYLQNVFSSFYERTEDETHPLSLRRLSMIYEQVSEETPGMPPLTPERRARLVMVVMSILGGMTIPYQFLDVKRDAAHNDLYRLFKSALEAQALPEFLKLDDDITQAEQALQLAYDRQGASVSAALKTMTQLKGLQPVIKRLKERSISTDVVTQYSLLTQARDLLSEREHSVETLQDPERYFITQILFRWQAVLNRELHKVGSGPAQLSAHLPDQHALPLDEIVVCLALKNEGPGIAFEIKVQLQLGDAYKVRHTSPLNLVLLPGESITLEFTLRPQSQGTLVLPFYVRYSDAAQQGKMLKFSERLEIFNSLPQYTRIPNRYVTGGVLRPDSPTFVGRKDVFEFIRQNLAEVADQRALILLGERKTGKTSVLMRLGQKLGQDRYLPVFVDCQSLPAGSDSGQFLARLATAIYQGLRSYRLSVPLLTLDQLGNDPLEVFENQFLPAVHQQIGERTLLLAIDEFEDLGAPSGMPSALLGNLRHLVQHGSQLAFILAGTHRLEEQIGDYWSELYNIGMSRRIGLLSREETIQLITEPVCKYGLEYDCVVLDEIIRLTAGHPFFTQLLCWYILDQCNKQRRSYVTLQHVREARRELVERNPHHLNHLWKRMDRDSKLILAGIAEAQKETSRVTDSEIINLLAHHSCPLPVDQVVKLLETLSTREIVRGIGGLTKAYDFTAQLYGYWLRHHWPLSKAVEELVHDRQLEPA